MAATRGIGFATFLGSVFARLLVTCALVWLQSCEADAEVGFSIDLSTSSKPISPHIYGMNSFFNSLPTGEHSGPAISLDRLGGNRWTGYNWETNHSNAGSDYFHVNDDYLTGYRGVTPPGEAVRPSLEAAANNRRSVLVTVPTAGFVSADNNGTVDASEAAPSPRWRQLHPNKSGVYPNAPLSLEPDLSDGFVFTDEFVNWVESTRAPKTTVFYSLDNEPGLWDQTHPRIYPQDPSFSDLRGRVLDHAAAVKDVAPEALVFGPVAFGWSEFQSLQGAPDQVGSPTHPGGDAPGEFNYLEWILNEVRLEEQRQGRALVDVLDVHWYPESRGDGTRITFGGVNNTTPAVAAARVQAPRSLWDPTFVEDSWITSFSTGGNPVALLPRLQKDIDDFKPGTRLAITEYNYGGGAHISGGVAQADVLGILGAQGVFAATWWNIEGADSGAAPFVYAAFDMFRNFDGAGGSFGDLSLAAESDDIETASVYASLHSDDPGRLTIVAINRSTNAIDARLDYDEGLAYTSASAYQLTGMSAEPISVPSPEGDLSGGFDYQLPPLSVTTFVLQADFLAGDYNNDGRVDVADYTVWRDTLGRSNTPAFAGADGDGDGEITESDYHIWRDRYQGSDGSALSTVPEPSSVALLLCFVPFRRTVRGSTIRIGR